VGGGISGGGISGGGISGGGISGVVVKIVKKKKDLQAILGEYRVRLEGVRAGAWSVRAGIFRRIFGLGERERNEGERNEGARERA
jgi:hypothetical protein